MNKWTDDQDENTMRLPTSMA